MITTSAFHETCRSRRSPEKVGGQVCLRVDAPAKVWPHVRLDHLDCPFDMSIEFVQILGGYPEFLVPRRADDSNGVPANEWIGDPKACDKTRVLRRRVPRVPIP